MKYILILPFFAILNSQASRPIGSEFDEIKKSIQNGQPANRQILERIRNLRVKHQGVKPLLTSSNNNGLNQPADSESDDEMSTTDDTELSMESNDDSDPEDLPDTGKTVELESENYEFQDEVRQKNEKLEDLFEMVEKMDINILDLKQKIKSPCEADMKKKSTSPISPDLKATDSSLTSSPKKSKSPMKNNSKNSSSSVDNKKRIGDDGSDDEDFKRFMRKVDAST